MKLRIEEPSLEATVSVHSPIAQKWPVCPVSIDLAPIDVRANEFFPIGTPFRENLAVRTADKALSPKLDSVAASWFFMTNSVRHRDVTTIRDCVAPLNRFPG